MGIRISEPTAQPAVVFDRVHLLRLEIEQPTFANDNLQPIYKLHIEYRLYGVDVDGIRHYKGETQEIVINDFLQDAISDYQAGDPTLYRALGGIEMAVAAIIADSNKIETSLI
jgi:hypothetical protein